MDSFLITCGLDAFAQRVGKELAPQTVYYASSESFPQALKSTGKYHSLVPATQDTFVHEILKLALDLQVSYIIPLDLEEIKILINENSLFSEYGIRVLVPSTFDHFPLIVQPPKIIPIEILEYGIGLQTAQPEVKPNKDDLCLMEYDSKSLCTGVFATNDDGEMYLCVCK